MQLSKPVNYLSMRSDNRKTHLSGITVSQLVQRQQQMQEEYFQQPQQSQQPQQMQIELTEKDVEAINAVMSVSSL